MFHFLFLSASLLLSLPSSTVPQHIRQVEIEGNARIPALTIIREIASKPNTIFDAAKLQADVKTSAIL